MDPGPQTMGNGYEASSRFSIPRDWRAAIDVARGSDFLREALGAEMHRTFIAVKEAEFARVARAIPEVDFELYLHRV